MDNADVIAQLASLQRRRALLDAMTKQNQEQQITGNTGIGQALLKVGNSALQGYSGQKLSEEETQARRNYGGQLKSEANAYLDSFATSPREAVVNAMASQYPEIQAIGKAGFAGLNKSPEKLSAKDLLNATGFDPDSRMRAAVALDPTLLKGDIETVTAGDQVFNKRDPGRGALIDARMGYQAPTRIAGDLYQQEDRPGGKLLKLDNAPKVSVSASIVNKGEDEFAKVLGKGTAESVLEARKEAQAGQRALSVVRQLKQLESQGVFNTPVPDAAIGLGQFSQALGIPVDRAKLANSEAFRQQVAKNVSDVILMGGAARSMTDEDRKAFERTLPSLILSPEGRAQVYAIMENGANTAMARNQAIQEQLKANPLYKDAPGMLTFNPVSPEPGPGAPTMIPPTPVPGKAPGGKPTVSNW